MSSDVDVSKLRKWIGKANRIGDPPQPSAHAGQTQGAAMRDDIVQFNVPVRVSVKKRAKQLAARDELKLGQLVERMVDLYEKEYGALVGARKQR
jgi:hypothetical protein